MLVGIGSPDSHRPFANTSILSQPKHDFIWPPNAYIWCLYGTKAMNWRPTVMLPTYVICKVETDISKVISNSLGTALTKMNRSLFMNAQLTCQASWLSWYGRSDTYLTSMVSMFTILNEGADSVNIGRNYGTLFVMSCCNCSFHPSKVFAGSKFSFRSRRWSAEILDYNFLLILEFRDSIKETDQSSEYLAISYIKTPCIRSILL
jgi:hypothetical protein